MSANAFPDEIWLNVLQNLNYLDLARVGMVSKRFRAMTEDRSLDRNLFRGKAVDDMTETPNLTEIKLHPIFRSLAYGCDYGIDSVWVTDATHTKRLALKDAEVANQLATMPPLKVVTVKHSHHERVARNKDGVTVLQVMEALCFLLSRELPRGVLLPVKGHRTRDFDCNCRDPNALFKVGDLIKHGKEFRRFWVQPGRNGMVLLADWWDETPLSANDWFGRVNEV